MKKKRTAITYLIFLRMFMDGWNIRPRLRIGEPRDPEKPEWFRLRHREIDNHRKHCLGQTPTPKRIADVEQGIEELKEDGCFWEQSDISKLDRWYLSNMVKKGLIQGDIVKGYILTALGLEVHSTEGFGKKDG
jgi:hypothetical protein